MALRTVVLEAKAPPPPPRRTVVLRPGGPVAGGGLRDLVVGILGAILLVACVVLANVLPDRTYLNPQFRVSYPVTPVDFPGASIVQPFAEGETHEFTYAIPDDNVVDVSIDLGFPDDIELSLPDRFTVELFDPLGASRGRHQVENPPPVATSDPREPASVAPAALTARFTIGAPPADEVVTGLHHRESQEQVLARVEPQARQATAGEWRLVVSNLFMGDCPPPGEGSYASQSLDCRGGRIGNPGATPSSNGQDTTNDFIIAKFTYSIYTVDVQEI